MLKSQLSHDKLFQKYLKKFFLSKSPFADALSFKFQRDYLLAILERWKKKFIGEGNLEYIISCPVTCL